MGKGCVAIHNLRPITNSSERLGAYAERASYPAGHPTSPIEQRTRVSEHSVSLGGVKSGRRVNMGRCSGYGRRNPCERDRAFNVLIVFFSRRPGQPVAPGGPAALLEFHVPA